MSLADRRSADPIEQIVTCSKCGRSYRQIEEDQVPGFRIKSEDECPYCGHVNHTSMSYEYSNYKLESGD